MPLLYMQKSCETLQTIFIFFDKLILALIQSTNKTLIRLITFAEAEITRVQLASG